MIDVKIIKDSIAPSGARLTTFLLKYPRFIHCFDKETEVLTELDGKKLFRRWENVVNTDAKIATYNTATSEILFEHPNCWIDKEVDENLIFIDNERLSMMVTKGHRLYIGSRKSKREKWETIKASKLLGQHTQKRFKTFGFFKGKVVDRNLCKLLGFFVGDGSIPKKGNQIIFHLKKDRKIKYLDQLLRTLNIDFDKRQCKDKTVNIVFYSDVSFFRDSYTKDFKKQIPEIILNSTRECFLAFLDGLWNSDGSTDKGYLKIFNTGSAKIANQLSTGASMFGERINLTKPHSRGIYKLTRAIEKEPILRRDKCLVREIKYKGRVFCANTSTGYLVVRRNGKVHISGNCEFMTHRMFSRNASSSRAIPVKKQIEAIEKEPAIPVFWGKNQKGMQATEEIKNPTLAKEFWQRACQEAINTANALNHLDVHKQNINRILEPFSHITVVCTATDYDNFFALRYHEAAMPEIQILAKTMWEAYVDSVPNSLKEGEWHLPFVDDKIDIEKAIIRSIACCARVSYNNHDSTEPTDRQNMELYIRLLGSHPIHASPAEHQAMAKGPRDSNFRSGNFRGWVQYRKTLDNENITKFEGPK